MKSLEWVKVMNQVPDSLPAQNPTWNVRENIYFLCSSHLYDKNTYNTFLYEKDQITQRLREQGIIILADGS